MYISHTLEYLRAIRRVLKSTGTLYLNLGDSYASSPPGNKQEIIRWQHGNKSEAGMIDAVRRSTITDGLKPLDLCGIPHRVALAAQADGWYWRSMIIWNKPNPMPESVAGWRWERHKVKVGNRGRTQARKPGMQDHSGNTVISDAIWQDCPGCSKCDQNDGLVLRKGSWRPTSSHDYILMLTKTADYYGDGESVREPHSPNTHARGKNGVMGSGVKAKIDPNKIGAWNKWMKDKPQIPNPAGRNLRSVWTFPTAPYPGAHFATFPKELVRRCILASTSDKGNCPKCGMPWARVSASHIEYSQNIHNHPKYPTGQFGHQAANRHRDGHIPGNKVVETLSWRPTCKCGLDPVPAVILDPFSGTGTALAVAKSLGRHSIGIDISPDYCAMARRRIESITRPMEV